MPSSWFESRSVSPGVTLITEPFVHSFFRANLYRIEGRDFDIQLDFGVGISSLSKAVPAKGKPVLAIATHAHVDHVGSFHEFERRAGHEAEAEIFRTMKDEGTLASWFTGQDEPIARPPYDGYSLNDYRLLPAPLSELLGDGDTVDTGSRRFTVLHLPGHSPGSIALLDENNGEFFSGDAIYDDELVDDIPGADIPVYLNTMKRLEKLDIRIGHGGHGPSFGKARMQAISRGYIEDRTRSGSAFL
ncbi:MBL fold metallo-hydrolase [Mesorhizobium sp. LHD-90]|uniref:MBL fold metallo-hydrolase n=1 Tax=Mesorhizobium sp. LHD-90 TaxID=3071414 RepID=UPI0027E147C7|nr:MBL fold metallo-hydrolase [Mesorhizobium sp. LHD-90]MDQ6433298.1 MBL fold metallo-hydrolase [Mesorhizobium sp. LHD-90]